MYISSHGRSEYPSEWGVVIIIKTRLNTTGVQSFWDPRNVADFPFLEHVDNGSRTQLHYNDPASLGLTYAFAKARGLLGVGMWQADDVGWGSPEMWQAIKDPNISKRHLRP
jgi:spore germination protein YaaH